MLSDEEKKAIEIVKEIKDIRGMRQDVDGENGDREDLLQLSIVYNTATFLDMNAKILDNIEDNTKEIEEFNVNEFDEDTRVVAIQNRNKINELVKAVNEIRKDKSNE